MEKGTLPPGIAVQTRVLDIGSRKEIGRLKELTRYEHEVNIAENLGLWAEDIFVLSFLRNPTQLHYESTDKPDTWEFLIESLEPNHAAGQKVELVKCEHPLTHRDIVEVKLLTGRNHQLTLSLKVEIA